MAGRFVWWKTNRDESALILAAGRGPVADGALTAVAGEAGLLTVVPDLTHVLGLAASADLIRDQGGSPAPDQRETPPLNPQRSLAHTLGNLTVPRRAKSLAQKLVSPAPRADPKSKRSVNPEAVPKRSLPGRSLEAAHARDLRAATRSIPQNFPPPPTASSPSLQPSALPPAAGLALDPDQPPKTDHFCSSIQKTMIGKLQACV